jgi:heat shock protein HtpX
MAARSRIPSDPWLTVRMVLVAVLTPLAAIALLATVAIVLPSRFLVGLAVALGFGTFARWVVHVNRTPPEGTALTEHDDPELFAIVDRLCVLADIPRPELVLSNQRQPNSWVVHLPHQTPRLYVTTGLRELLTLSELQAVLGHELTHIANHDAMVMTVVGMPGSVMLRARGGGVDGLLVVAIGMLAQIGTAILSRYRELTADAGAAAITARPSALASALLKVSGSLEQLPAKDLRAAAALNAFNLIAVPRRRRRGCPRSRMLGRLMATHPPLQSRLDALFALEREQQFRHGS